MAIPAALVVVPIGMLFILSGLIVNSIQVLQNSPFVYNFAFPCNIFFLILNFITKMCLPFGVWNLKLQELRLSNFGYNEKKGAFYSWYQAVLFILVRPVTKRVYRRINKIIVELLWLELIWLIDWWACIKVFDWLLLLNPSVIIFW